MFKKVLKYFTYSTIVTSSIFLASPNNQNKQNVKGAFRSIINSSRAAIILYRAVQDYELSLSEIQYNSEQYHQIRHEVHLRVANSILQLSKENRGIYLKLGQYLGNLEKVVPWEFTHVLKVLQDSAPPIDYEQIKVVIENDLQKRSEDIFISVDSQAIAAASLAQVHKAILKSNGKTVALKVQYPFLKIQSKWDLKVLGKITQLCNYLIKRNKGSNNTIDFVKLFDTWTSTLVEQLDFNIQLSHALKTKKLFENYPYLYIPHYYQDLSSDRLIVMEYVEGAKINNKEEIMKKGIKPALVASNLIKIFRTMIFQHGFIHCDAHPGNILVRKQDNQLGHDIVLLDHGLYRSIRPQTIQNFSGLWINLLVQNKSQVYKYAERLNIHEHFEYLPLIFLNRSRSSQKLIGADITLQEKKEFRQKDLANFDSINKILQDLPPEIMFIIRASNLIGSHNVSLGGNNRNRLFQYSKSSLRVLYPSTITYLLQSLFIFLKIFLFEACYPLYKYTFGTLQN